MSKFISKITKIGFWALTATFLLSGTKPDRQKSLVSGVTYDYSLEVSGSLNRSFSGVIVFETATETTSKGVPFSTLKLKFNSSESVFSHSLEFLIAKENTEKILDKGRYDVIRNQNGLLNYFDGVFGFANINVLGELPFFAKSGKIQINHLDKNMIAGSLDIRLNNAVDQSIHIKGNFETKK